MQAQPAPNRRDTASIVAALLVFVGALIVVVGVPQPDARVVIEPLTIDGAPTPEVIWSGRGFRVDDLMMPVLPIAISVVCAIVGLAVAQRWFTVLSGVPALLVLVFGMYFVFGPDDFGNVVISSTIASGTVMVLAGTAVMVIGAVIALVRELQSQRALSQVAEPG